MLTAVCQRWRERRGVYRPAGEVIDTRRYEVAAIPGDREARSFVQAHHYSGSYPAARFRYGLYRGEALVGVAVYSVPVQPKCLDVLPCERAAAVELGRLVLLDDVPANGESWFVAETFRRLRGEGIAGVVSFADPVARSSSSGDIVFPGHLGTIYQALNATYVGRSTARTLRLLPDGTVLSPRAIQKAIAGERGRDYVVRLLVEHGAALPDDEDIAAWTRTWVAKLTRPLKHEGCHKYAWSLDRAGRRHLPASLAYPKVWA